MSTEVSFVVLLVLGIVANILSRYDRRLSERTDDQSIRNNLWECEIGTELEA
jgi:divalent metal cation (Fe/Co/Zn/Cd) transporter